MAHQVCFRRRLFLTCASALSAMMIALASPGLTVASPGLQSEQEGGIAISAFQFEPGVLTVNVGAAVTWVNTDGVPHTSTASSNHRWGELITTNDAFTYTFDTPGTYFYFCEMHPAMVGSITVVAE
jgi:plastocyanin